MTDYRNIDPEKPAGWIDTEGFRKQYFRNPARVVDDLKELLELRICLAGFKQCPTKPCFREVHNRLTYLIDNYPLTKEAQKQLLGIRQNLCDVRDYSPLEQTIQELLPRLEQLLNHDN